MARKPNIEMDISMVFHKPIRKMVPVETNSYIFKPAGRWAWLQKLAWRFLQRNNVIQQYCFLDERYTYRRVIFNSDDVMKNLFEANTMLSRLNYKPRRIYMGPDDMMELTNQADFHHFAYLNQPTRFEGTIGYNNHLFGLPVEIIPHMKGVLVI